MSGKADITLKDNDKGKVVVVISADKLTLKSAKAAVLLPMDVTLQDPGLK